MFGHRTPVRKSNSAEKKETNSQSQEAGQMRASHVRRSIGEWEAVNPSQSSSNPSPRAALVAAAAPCKVMSPLTQGLTGEGAEKLSAETAISPKPKYKNRTSEARACLTSAKLQLGKARNLRTDIKNEVTHPTNKKYSHSGL
ncbi:hypothetical protein JYU34_009979 [Plutella xylostella]|uniref:Uncharacterized protein n=1 Tax=Plutella xylostella TaxID=51655 RepID=A0ABQ7QKY4_PLUXY|nr:hypothetical protein JYU34_009979 [Plutella xylostella]